MSQILENSIMENEVELNELKKQLDAALNSLIPRTRYILEQIFYRGRTQSDLAKEFGVSPHRIHQIKYNGLRRLNTHKFGLKIFIE